MTPFVAFLTGGLVGLFVGAQIGMFVMILANILGEDSSGLGEK